MPWDWGERHGDHGVDLGLIGGLFGLLIGLFGYGVAAIASASGHSGAGLYQLISIATPIASLVGAGLAKANAVAAGVLMLASAAGMLWLFGFNFFTVIPLALTALGGVFALMALSEQAPTTGKP